MKVLRHLSLAFGFLTRIPVPPVRDFRPDDLRGAAPWFPLVGAVLGAGLAGALWAIGDRPGPAALAALVVWVGITGALHLDGLGDVADAFGAAHRSPERFLEVLKDPHLGVFGVVAIGVQLLTKLVLLAELAGHHGREGSEGLGGLGGLIGLALVPAWARWATLVSSKTVPPLPGNPTSTLSSPHGWVAVAVWPIVLGAVAAVTAPVTLVAVPLALLATAYWRARLGAINGDCLGATIEVVESLLLCALVAAAWS